MSTPRPDHGAILELVRAGSSVLDLGCGDGELLALLVEGRKVDARGIERDEQAIYRCVERGLSVCHGDIDSGLSEYGDGSFDYVILNQSLQQVQKPDAVMTEALRVGLEVIIGVPNFAHYSARLQLGLFGKTPVTEELPWEWHRTPNLRFLSLLDFLVYCRARGIRVAREIYLAGRGRVKVCPNLRARVGIFLLNKGR